MDHSVLEEVMRKSVDYATELNHEYVTCEHLMNSLLSLPELQKLATMALHHSTVTKVLLRKQQVLSVLYNVH